MQNPKPGLFSYVVISAMGLPPVKRPPGPPPGGAPLNSIKPPPMAPPPQLLAQTMQRPAVEGNKVVSDKEISMAQAGQIAPGKDGKEFHAAAPYKAGAIAMFENETESKNQKAAEPPAESKPVVTTSSTIAPPRGPPPPRGQVPSEDPTMLAGRMQTGGSRPLPPAINPPGIPDGQPLPPTEKYPKDQRAPPPTRLPPNRNRAPPREEPVSGTSGKSTKSIVVQPQAAPPDSAAPLQRVKKSKADAVVLKRREKDMPEYESSSDDEEEPVYVQQPLPFGVIKQPLPTSSLAKQQAAPAAATTAAAAAAVPMIEEKQVPAAISDSIKVPSDESSSMTSPPSLAPPSENKLAPFVPAAPDTLGEKHFDDSKLGKLLSKGRLSIRCVEGFDIRQKTDQDKVPRNDSFIKFRLGVAERHPWKNTEVKRKQDANPKFDGEIVSFDITDPAQFIFQEDLQLCIELWNKGVIANSLVASVSMSVVRFMKNPFVSYAERIPVYYPGATRTSMKVSTHFNSVYLLLRFYCSYV